MFFCSIAIIKALCLYLSTCIVKLYLSTSITSIAPYNVCLLFVVMLIGIIVIIMSIEYINVLDLLVFIIYLMLFIISMLCIVIVHKALHLFLHWELLGITSYLLINFFSSRLNCGLKAVIYNKIGDLFLLLLLAYMFSFIGLLNYNISVSYSFMIFIIIFIYYCGSSYTYSSTLFALLFIMFPFAKSAQLPFSSWLINAMSAPTPISALLHSSTMVILGIYVLMLSWPLFSILLVSFIWIYLLIVIATLYWSLIMALACYDLKSLIAFSTVSQLSYMFVGLLTSPNIVLYHIIVHAFFKSYLFIVAGSIIHASNHYQNIYKLTMTSSVLGLFIINNIILITAISKEAILYTSYYFMTSLALNVLLLISTLLTICYVLHLLYYITCSYCLIDAGLTYYCFLFLFYILWHMISYMSDVYFLNEIAVTMPYWSSTLCFNVTSLSSTYSIFFIWAMIASIMLASYYIYSLLCEIFIKLPMKDALLRCLNNVYLLPSSMPFMFSSNSSFYIYTYIFLFTSQSLISIIRSLEMISSSSYVSYQQKHLLTYVLLLLCIICLIC